MHKIQIPIVRIIKIMIEILVKDIKIIIMLITLNNIPIKAKEALRVIINKTLLNPINTSLCNNKGKTINNFFKLTNSKYF